MEGKEECIYGMKKSIQGCKCVHRVNHNFSYCNMPVSFLERNSQ